MPPYRWPRQLRLKLYMVEHEWTTQALAEAIGVSAVTTSGVLSGRCRPTPRLRGLISEALGEPAESLFTDIDDSGEMIEPYEPRLGKTAPPPDAETLEKVRQLLFPRPARRATPTPRRQKKTARTA